MNFLTKKLYKWQLPKILSRICGSRIPRLGEAGKKVNCYVIALDRDSAPYFLVSGLDGNNLTGRIWDGSSYANEGSIPLESIIEHDFFITHYYGFSEIKYHGIYDFIINKITLRPYIKINAYRLIESVDQYFFNKKKLVTKQRIDLLKFMMDDQIERSHSGISEFDLMTKLYSFKWVLHPEGDAQKKKLALYLDSLVKSGNLEKINSEYVVTGRAISSIERFEEEERRHVENVKIQRKIAWLTFIIALLTMIQAGLIKLPTIIDLTDLFFY